MYLLSLLTTLLCALTFASASPDPEAFDKHDLYIRGPAVAFRDRPVEKPSSFPTTVSPQGIHTIKKDTTRFTSVPTQIE